MALPRSFLVAALTSAGAALVHSVAIREHLEEWWGYGVFFLLMSVAQAFYAVLLLLRPWRRKPPLADEARIEKGALVAGIVGQSFLVLLYVVTRTVGIPFFGPEAGEVEPVTTAGVLAKALELACIVALAAALRPRVEGTMGSSSTA